MKSLYCEHGNGSDCLQCPPTPGIITDAQRLTYLESLIKAAPHCEITYNDDPDAEDDMGLIPVGFIIRVDGCEVSRVCAPTFRECVDKEILAAQREDWSHE